MISLEEAQARLLDDAIALEAENVALLDACGRILASDVSALLTHPPFPASAMDGYAIRFADLHGPWQVIGESAAGAANFANTVQPGEAVRIFTGAPVPEGADTILVQEETSLHPTKGGVGEQGSELVLTGEGPPHQGAHIRPAGLDFTAGDTLATAGTRVSPALAGLLAAGGHATAPVHRRPRVVLLATGNELVPPGAAPGPGQIVSSNGVMLSALFAGAGAAVEDRSIVRDDLDALTTAIRAASGADLLVTIGGASVGDYDLVAPALKAAGATIDFWKVALRPGKPVMTGTLGRCRVLGLPGNPVSAYVCALLFGLPLVRKLSGDAAPLPRETHAVATAALPGNGARRDFLRATVTDGQVTPAARQDSAMLGVLARSNALIVRPPHAPPIAAGEQVVIIPLDKESFAS